MPVKNVMHILFRRINYGQNFKTDSKNIKVVKNFPKKEFLFQDIFSLTKKPKIFNSIINEICLEIKRNNITKLIGIESRGFIFASVQLLSQNFPLFQSENQINSLAPYTSKNINLNMVPTKYKFKKTRSINLIKF